MSVLHEGLIDWFKMKFSGTRANVSGLSSSEIAKIRYVQRHDLCFELAERFKPTIASLLQWRLNAKMRKCCDYGVFQNNLKAFSAGKINAIMIFQCNANGCKELQPIMHQLADDICWNLDRQFGTNNWSYYIAPCDDNPYIEWIYCIPTKETIENGFAVYVDEYRKNPTPFQNFKESNIDLECGLESINDILHRI